MIGLKEGIEQVTKMPAISTRRSDQLRKKRSASLGKLKPATTRRKKSTLTPSVPPVMARSPAPALSTKDLKTVRKTRRRFDVALNTPGVEMRLPALPQIQLGWRLLTFLLLVGFTFGLYTLWTSAYFRVETAQVVGLKRITSEAVNTVLGVSGQSIFALDAVNLEKMVSDEFQEFSSAEVEVTLLNSVVVTVTERVPVLIWIQNERTSLVDQDGMTFPVRLENENMSLPAIEAETSPPAPPAQKVPVVDPETVMPLDSIPFSALEGGDNLDDFSLKPLLTREMVAAVLLMAENAPEGANLIYTAEHGLVWQDKRGWSVYFGTPDEMEMKLKVYRSILDFLKTQDTRPEMISVEFLSAPYYRLAG